MGTLEAQNVATVLQYFDGCNSGNVEELLATLAPDVVHYFLSGDFKTIHGADHLANYWRKHKEVLDPTWRIDEIIGSGDRVVSEWSCLWTPRQTGLPVMTRGTEWYILRDGRIAEVRAYFVVNVDADSELPNFPYASRGYLGRPSATGS
jgi:ketosteroid isomerase-like protein